jgi:hypothetical protein
MLPLVFWVETCRFKNLLRYAYRQVTKKMVVRSKERRYRKEHECGQGEKKLAASGPFKENTSLSLHMGNGIVRKMRSFNSAASVTNL